MVQKVVLTGSSCCGKTSVLERLEDLGHTVVEEQARILIKEGHRPEQDPPYFQRMVSERMHAAENSIWKDANGGLVVHDRGLPDVIAYSAFYNVATPPLAQCDPSRYDLVFLLELLPSEFYVVDAERKETYQQAQELHNHIIDAYTSRNIPLLIVPYQSTATIEEGIERRVQHILTQIELFSKLSQP